MILVVPWGLVQGLLNTFRWNSLARAWWMVWPRSLPARIRLLPWKFVGILRALQQLPAVWVQSLLLNVPLSRLETRLMLSRAMVQLTCLGLLSTLMF